MAWSEKDVDQHIKGLSEKQKGKWVSVANGVLKNLRRSRMEFSKAESKAIRIANSKFSSVDKFNPLIPAHVNFNLNFNGNGVAASPTAIEDEMNKSADVDINDIEDTTDLWLTHDRKERLDAKVKECVELGGSEVDCRQAAISKMKRGLNFKSKNFQYTKLTPPDPFDGHVHTCAYDENGDGGTDEAGQIPHSHTVYDFRVQPFSTWDVDEQESYVSVHPGSLAFGELMEIPEMEIFRAGTHNGDEFTVQDLELMASNFQKLKSELRPKLKITHSDEQESLAGLASYGDVVDVFVKKVEDGSKRLFAKLNKVPKEVYEWVKEGRFAERSIELYPEFKLGTKENSPIYKNVLKAIALLGSQMPAVTGMEPIKLEECLECQGTSCFRESVSSREAATDYSIRFMMFEKTIELERKKIAV